MAEKKSWQEWKTTIVGVITFAIGILVAVGILTPADQEALNQSFTSISELIPGLVVAISGIINVFRAR